MATDIVDGLLSRQFGRTALGNYLDPIADKVLVLSVCVALTMREMLPVAVTLIFIAREFIVSGVRDMAALGGRVVGANWMGKTKSFLQVALVAAALWLLSKHANAFGVQISSDWNWYLPFAWCTAILSAAFAGTFVFWHRKALLNNGNTASVVEGQDAK